jgi:flagellar biosynthetic protein FliR
MEPDLFHTTYRQIETLLLVMTRVSALFIAAPVFGNRNIPTQLKAAMALIIGVLLTFSMPPIPASELSRDTLTLIGKVASEFLVGIAISYSAYLLFAGIQLAGQIVDIQMGFGLVNVIDPQTNAQVSIIGQFYYLIAILVFLAINGHHVLLRAMGDSFHLIGPGAFSLAKAATVTGPVIAEFFTKLLVIAFQIAGPAILTLFLTTVAMGVLSRTMPQMNIFIVGLPINVVVGMLITFATLHVMGGVLRSVVSGMGTNITRLLTAMAGA